VIKSDLFESLTQLWNSIGRRYKIAFFSSLAINVFVFLIFIVHQPLHNHGILNRLLYTSPYEQYPAGRWFSVLILYVFNSSNLMVILPVATIMLHILGGILSVYLWDRNSSAFQFTAGALIISLYPAVMTSFYFSFVGPIFSGPHLLAPLALFAASSNRIRNVAFSAVIICIMMATYQPGISVISTIFITYFIIKVIDFKGNLKAFIAMFSHCISPKIIAICIGGILYRFSLFVFGIEITQTTSTISFSEIPSKFFLTLHKSFSYLYITQPELMKAVKLALLTVVILAFITLMVKACSYSSSHAQKVMKLTLIIGLSVCSVLSTKAMYLISANENFWTYRYNHSLAYLYMFGFFILFKYWGKGLLKNIAYLIFLFVVIKFSYSNIGRQQLLLRAQTHYLSIANRILYRIESLPGIDYKKQYKVVRVGRFSEFQPRLLRSRNHNYDIGGDVHMDSELSPIWGPGDIFNYLGSRVKFHGYMNNNFKNDIALAEKLVEGRQSWPSKDSVFIHNDMIIINLLNQ
jgi:hypothetical protein